MRFAGADTTVKLRQDMTYIISITTLPAVAVSVEAAEVKHRQCDCQEPSVMCCCMPQATAYADLSEMVSPWETRLAMHPMHQWHWWPQHACMHQLLSTQALHDAMPGPQH